MVRFLVSLSAALSLTWGSANAGIVYFDSPDPLAANVATPFSVQVRGQGFPVGIDGGGLEVRFDSAAVQVDSVQIDPLWNDLFSEGDIDNAAGAVTDVYFNTFSPGGVTGDFPILTLTLSPTAPGTTRLSLAASLLFPFGAGGEEMAVDFSLLTLQVSAIPEPSSLLMVGGGLSWLLRSLWWRRHWKPGAIGRTMA